MQEDAQFDEQLESDSDEDAGSNLEDAIGSDMEDSGRESTAPSSMEADQDVATVLHVAQVGKATILEDDTAMDSPTKWDLQVSPDFDTSSCGARPSMGMDAAINACGSASNRSEHRLEPQLL